MGRKFSFVFILFLFCVVSTACSKENTFDNALLWKVSGKDLDKPSYIFGTHHLADVGFLDRIGGLDNVINEIDQVVGEIVLSPENMAEIQMKIQKAGIFAVGDGYKKILSPEDYKKLDRGLRDLFTVGISEFERLKPGLINSMVAQKIYSMVDSVYNPMTHEPIDMYLQRVAREKGKSVIGLETADDQIYVLFEFEPLKNQAQTLVCALENIEWGKNVILELNRFYENRSLSAIYALSFQNEQDPCPVSDKQMKALNEDRNNKWLEKLPAIMKEKSSLIAVGVLHLSGKEGLLYQLDKLGYTVEAVD